MTADPVAVRTDRLLIGGWREDEAGRHGELRRRPEVVRFLGSTPAPMRSVERARARIERVRAYDVEVFVSTAPAAAGAGA